MIDYKSYALFELYPSVKTYKGEIPEAVAYDENSVEVNVDMAQVEQEAIRIESEEIAQAEAKAQLRTSVINKIATNLTSEEKLWLEENL